MANRSDPRNWTAPSWPHDSGDPEAELDALRALSLAILGRNPGVELVLDPFEPGYLKVDLVHGGSKFGELYCEAGNDGFSLFLGEGEREEEYHFKDEADGVLAVGRWLSSH